MNTHIKDLTTGTDLEHLLEAVRDTLSDEMIVRLANTLSGSLDLLDRLNRSGVMDALPVLERLIGSGDLERLQRLLPRMLDLLEGLDRELLDGLSRSLVQARQDSAEAPAALGGVGGFWAILREPENQETIRFFLNFGKHLKNAGNRETSAG